jgi:hypothetical protein
MRNPAESQLSEKYLYIGTDGWHAFTTAFSGGVKGLRRFWITAHEKRDGRVAG